MDKSEQQNPQSQPPKIKILQIVQKNLANLGVDLSSANRIEFFNGEIAIDFLILAIAIIWILLYIFNDAETFTEYTQSIFICSTFILMILALTITIFNSTKLNQIINDCECLINILSIRTNRI